MFAKSSSLTLGRRRALRFALGLTLGSAIGYPLVEQMPFLVAMFAGMLLAPGAKPMPPKLALVFVFIMAVALSLGDHVSQVLIAFPVMFLLVDFALIFLLFYGRASGVSPVMITFLFLGVLMIPVLSLVSPLLGSALASAMPLIAGLGVIVSWVCFVLIPEPAVAIDSPAVAPAPAPSSSPQERASEALRNTAVVYPLALIFFMFDLSSQLLILIKVALLTGTAFGVKESRGLLYSTFLGGVLAVFVFHLQAAFHEFWFFLLLTFLLGLLIGGAWNSGGNLAPYMQQAFVAAMVLIGTQVTSVDGDAAAKYYIRFAQILVAALWILLATEFVSSFWPKRRLVKT